MYKTHMIDQNYNGIKKTIQKGERNDAWKKENKTNEKLNQVCKNSKCVWKDIKEVNKNDRKSITNIMKRIKYS